MADYDDILNRTWDDIPEPQLLPNGGWMLSGANVALVKPKEDNQALKVLFSYKAKQPTNVADDLLEELGEYDFTINDLTFTIYVETAADWSKVKKHLAKHGVEVSGALFNEAGKLAFAKAFRGSEVIAEVGQRSYEDAAGETIWQNTLSKFQAVEE